MLAERKDDFFGKHLFPKKRKGESEYEQQEQQPAEHSPGPRGCGQVQDAGCIEVGVNLTNGYNGHLTSREAGSVGGQMVKYSLPIRTFSSQRHIRTAYDHQKCVKYIAVISI